MAIFTRFSGRLLGLVTLALLAVVGCGKSQNVTVSGTISYKGQPLQSGILKFVGPQGTYSAATIHADGKFTITDVVPGEVKVGVVDALGGSKQGGPERKTPHVSLPEKYRDPSTSGLQYTITPQTTELTIDIK
jgi:hypothetical protein